MKPGAKETGAKTTEDQLMKNRLKGLRQNKQIPPKRAVGLLVSLK